MLDMPSERFVDRMKDLFMSFFVKVDTLSLCLSVVAFCLRLFPSSFPIARLFMIVSLVCYFMGAFKIHMANSYLGPKVNMISRMSWDLGMFLTVVVVFFASYTVASLSLTYTHHTFHWGIFWDLFNRGIWEIFGQPSEKSMQGGWRVLVCRDRVAGYVPECENRTTLDCALRRYPIPVMLAVYLFFGNILLVNMLIAIFT